MGSYGSKLLRRTRIHKTYQGIEIEGTVKIQCHNYETNTIDILYENEGNDWDEEDEFLDMKITCMFPYMLHLFGVDVACICIDVDME